MKSGGVCGVALSLLLAAAMVSAEVRVTGARTEVGGPAFKFDNVPPPSKSDAAGKATFTIVDGQRDRNGARPAALNDGAVPRSEDQPAANFFFGGAGGGRVAADLGAVVDVKQVNTYSRHPGARGPQVYTLYASDGSSADFSPQPKRGTDPEKVGWKRLASVDTRPKDGEPGGHHAASVADPAGTLGKFRHLLFDIVPTENGNGMSNTFYSEIDVVDAAAAEAPVAAVQSDRGRELVQDVDAPAAPPLPPIVAQAEGGYEISFDYSEAPDLKEWIDTKLKPVCVKWYPVIVGMLPSDGYEAPKRFTIGFRPGLRVPAFAGGGRITCSVDWFRRNLEGEAAGAVVHEMVHVVQQYRRGREGNRNPGWLVEGLADWIRWFNYEDESKRPRPRADRANYNDSYRTTGHFLDYVINKYDKDLIRKLNVAMREGRYSDDLWKQWTGKTLEELGQEWKQGLPKG